jgi:hypothetical protein
MTENRPVANLENRSEPSALARNDAMANRVNPWLEDVQSASLNAAVDRAGAQTQGDQLLPTHHPILPPRQPSHRPVPLPRLHPTPHSEVRCSLGWHAGKLARQSARVARGM